MLNWRDETFVGYADGDFLCGKNAVEFRHRQHHRVRLIAGGIDDVDDFAVEIDRHIEPGVGSQAAMLVEAVGEIIRRKDNRGHVVGHLIEHCALRAVQIDRSHQHDLFVGRAFLLRDGKQAGRLQVPQFQCIESPQIGLLDFGQRLPSFRFVETFKFSRTPHDVAEIETVGRQLAMQPRQHFAQRQPGEQVSIAGRLPNDLQQSLAVGLL